MIKDPPTPILHRRPLANVIAMTNTTATDQRKVKWNTPYIVMRMANGLADFSLQLWLFGWNSYWWLQAMATFGCCIYATDRLAMATLSFSYCFSTYEKQWASWLWAEAALFSYPFIATWLWLHLAVHSQILPFLLLFHSLHFHVLSAVLTCMHYLMYFFLVICP